MENMTQLRTNMVNTDKKQGKDSLDNLYPIGKKDLKEVCKVLEDAFSKDPLLEAWDLKGEEINTGYEMFIRYDSKCSNISRDENSKEL